MLVGAPVLARRNGGPVAEDHSDSDSETLPDHMDFNKIMQLKQPRKPNDYRCVFHLPEGHREEDLMDVVKTSGLTLFEEDR